MFTEEEILKLPKWAQLRIKAMMANISIYDQKISEINGTSETNTFMYEGLSKRPLPNNSNIAFRFERNTVEIRIKGDRLNVYHHGDDKVAIRPEVSNVLNICFIKD